MLVGLPAVFEAVAVPVHFEDVDMVSEAIEECSGMPFRGRHPGFVPLWAVRAGAQPDRTFLAAQSFLGDPNDT